MLNVTSTKDTIVEGCEHSHTDNNDQPETLGDQDQEVCGGHLNYGETDVLNMEDAESHLLDEPGGERMYDQEEMVERHSLSYH